jgi:Bacterial Ig-like domain (group 3)
MRALALGPILLVVACYAPSYEGLACGTGSACPDGYRCSSENRCTLAPGGPAPGNDTTPPTTTISSRPPEFDTQRRPTFEFSCDEADCTFQCRLDGAELEPCVGSYIPPELGEGEHTLEVAATDAAGNQESPPIFVRWSLDVTPPAMTIASGPSPISGATVSFNFEANEPVTGYECNLEPVDAGAFVACTPPFEYADLANGEYTFRVRATDRAGQLGAASPAFTWTVDSTAFSASIVDGPPATSGRSVTFTLGSTRAGSTYECSLDPPGAPVYTDCTSPVTYEGLGAGVHTFYARAENPVETYSNPISQTWTVDATGPTTTISGGVANGSWTKESAVTYSLSCDEPPCQFECRRDGGTFVTAAGGTCGLSGLGEGSHTFDARSTDPRQNLGAVASRVFQVDLTLPAIDVVDPWAPGEPHCHSGGDLPFTFSASDAPSGIAVYGCKISKNGTVIANGACGSTTGFTVGGLVNGNSYQFTVTITDNAGNSRSDGVGWVQRSPLQCSQM